MFRILHGDNILNIASSLGAGINGSGVSGNVYLKYSLNDIDRPLVVTFSNAGEITHEADLYDKSYSPWGFDFVKRYGVNVISFSCVGFANWYRSETFLQFVTLLSKLLKIFRVKLGYGGSMGGYAASVFSNSFGFNRQLLMNPISTLAREIVPWETRFKGAMELNWNENYYDGAQANSKNIIVYDPIFTLDYKHAQRYRNRIELKIPGVGHGVPKHLNNLRVLKLVFEMFLNDNIQPQVFHRFVRSRRYYDGYYNWMLSRQNSHLTIERRRVIEFHRNKIPKNEGSSCRNFNDAHIDLIRDTAIKIEGLNIGIANELMLLAHNLRPNGKQIKSKLVTYSKMLCKNRTPIDTGSN
ncbi:hypothetical protein [Vibrio sp. CUB2]|uniref:hypothetical protein n=1 Tax=Vibrio sp. CUB2 TaxID=2315233 RepID=UPI00076AD275|nr:hypothetical protein [Vibrio sp. CUB2]